MARRKRTNKSRQQNKSPQNTENVEKSLKAYRMPKRGIGTAGIAFYQDMVNRLQPYELRWPQSMRTFEAMRNDDAIATVLKLNYNLIEAAFSDFEIEYNKNSEKSKQAADFVKWCLANLDSNSFLQVIRNVQTFKEKGFSIIEKIYRQVEDGGEFEGMWRVSDLSNRPQLSLDFSTPFEIESGGRRIKAMRQWDQFFQNKFNNNYFIPSDDMTGRGYKRIPRKKFMLFGENATDTTPFGTPILRSCYKAWKEKVLLEDLEVNGASKDLAGIIELAVPGDILDKAAIDPTSAEAAMVNDLMSAAANIHSGEQPYVVLPSDLQEGSSSVKEYSATLKGLEGGGKQFSPMEMIQKRRRAIFDIWGAGAALTGEGSVSYNSAEVKNAIHMHYIKADIKTIEDVFNRDLIPQLLNVMNEMGLSYQDLPKLKAGDIENLSADEAGKLVQRGLSVNGIAKTKDNIISWHQKLGFNTKHMEGMSEDELLGKLELGSKGDSRAGEGLGTSGTGDTQSAQGGDMNLENKNERTLKYDGERWYWLIGSEFKEYLTAEEIEILSL